MIKSTDIQHFEDALDLCGNSWTLHIVNAISDGELRFNELQRAVEGINPTTLAGRLKKLESDGVLVRQEETRDKLSVTYALTEKGRGLLPVLREIKRYSERFSS